MLVKLTYYGTNRPTLVNLENVESIYQVFDKLSRRYSTKICFRGNESYINVEEDLQTILRLDQETKEGHYQSYVWETPSLEERLETNYNQYKGRSNQFVPRERNFNQVEYQDRPQNDWT